MPISWRGTPVQYAGRLHRLRPGNTEVRNYDYADRRISVLNRMYERRLAGYRLSMTSRTTKRSFDGS